MSAGLPASPRRGDADVAARLLAIDRARRHAALATDAGGRPYLSLVAFALAPGGGAVLFATPRDSRKYRNLRRSPRVALLLDTRGERDRDCRGAEAITVTGRASVLRAGSSRWREAERALRAMHPALATFFGAPTTALVSVGIEEAVHVGGFLRATAWRPASGADAGAALAGRSRPSSRAAWSRARGAGALAPAAPRGEPSRGALRPGVRPVRLREGVSSS